MDELKRRVDEAADGFKPSAGSKAALERVERTARRRSRLHRAGVISAASVVAGASLLFLFTAFSAPARRQVTGANATAVFTLERAPDGTTRILKASADEASVLYSVPPPDVVRAYPDVAVGQDQKIYLAYTDESGSQRMDTLDSTTGKVVRTTPLSDLVATQLPVDYLSVAMDGTVYVYQGVLTGPGAFRDKLVTIDAASGKVLPNGVDLGQCGGPGFVFPLGDARVGVLCDIPREMRFYTLSEGGAAAARQTVPLPPVENDGSTSSGATDFVVAGDMSDDRSKLYLVTQAGDVFTIDTIEGSLMDVQQLKLSSHDYVAWDGFSIVPGSNSVLVSVGSTSDFEAFRATSLAEIELGSWAELGRSALPASTRGKVVATSDGAGVMYIPETEKILLVTPEGPSSGIEQLPSGNGVPFDIEASA